MTIPRVGTAPRDVVDEALPPGLTGPGRLHEVVSDSSGDGCGACRPSDVRRKLTPTGRQADDAEPPRIAELAIPNEGGAGVTCPADRLLCGPAWGSGGGLYPSCGGMSSYWSVIGR